MHVRIIRSFAVAIAATVAFPTSSGAGAEEERQIIVAEFEGDGPSAEAVREEIVDLVGDFYEILPYSRFRLARRRLNITKDSIRSFAQLARKVGADAIIEGQLGGRNLTISVREGRSGRVLGRFKVAVPGGRRFSDELRERISDELVDLIGWTEPIDGGDGELAGSVTVHAPDDDDAPRAEPAAVQKPPTPVATSPSAPSATVWTAKEPAKPKAKVDRRPPALQVRGGIGVAATARQLQFSHRADLDEAERPIAVSGSPAAGIAASGSFDVPPLGVSADVLYQRSIGASVSFPNAGQTQKLGITLQHIGGRLLARRPIGRRGTVRGGLGYHQLSYAITGRPNGLNIPDSRYAYVDVVGGGRLSLRDDRFAVTGDIWYLFVLAAGGITDADAYGSSRFQGFGGELGLEIQATDSTFVRLAGTYNRIILSFAGDGALATGLDESADVDVSGASDTFMGLTVMLGFRL